MGTRQVKHQMVTARTARGKPCGATARRIRQATVEVTVRRILLIVIGLSLAATASAQDQPAGSFCFALSAVSEAQQGDVVRFSRVTLAVDGITITADEAVFNKATQEVEFRGSVRAKLPPRQ